MIRIGILGDIGSGKSFVAKQFKSPVFNADAEIIKIYKNNKKCFYKLKKTLPKYIKSFPIKKKELRRSVISNNKNLKKISKVVHPIVRAEMRKFFVYNKKKKIVILDIPLLIENKLNKKTDILVYVDAKEKDIKKRLKKRKGYNEKIINNFKKKQYSLTKKKKLSDYVIKNNFKPNTIKQKVEIIKKKVLI